MIIDIVCYRRNGHNEQDQPSFTSPLMYEHIGKHPTTLDIYTQRLIAEGVVTADYVEAEKARINGNFEEAFVQSADYKDDSLWMESRWTKFKNSFEVNMPTGLPREQLERIGVATTLMPEGFTLHKALGKIMKKRAKSVTQGFDMDFATCEAMAFGSLLEDGFHVRISGQDVQRGTFSHRHALVHDQQTQETHIPLNFLQEDQPEFTVSNSHLSEYGVLGFEVGYDMHSPQQLVLWEAQFGDFANTAQCVIDQFISAGQTKWMRQSGLVMLLPHGYEGMGPEHSSARVERFLQMTEEDPDVYPEDQSQGNTKQHEAINWAITNCSTAGNYYHALRRQIYRGFRKPLVSIQPKSLLRLKEACASMDDITEGTHFMPVLPEAEPEALVAPEDVKRLVLCSGKVYYDLARARSLNSIDDVAIARVEELAPFPYGTLRRNVFVGLFRLPWLSWFRGSVGSCCASPASPLLRTPLHSLGSCCASLPTGRRAWVHRFEKVKEVADTYPNAEVIWCQEEPLNQVRPRRFPPLPLTPLPLDPAPSYPAGRMRQGPWLHVEPRIVTALAHSEHHTGEWDVNAGQRYAGRPASASTSTGSPRNHRPFCPRRRQSFSGVG